MSTTHVVPQTANVVKRHLVDVTSDCYLTCLVLTSMHTIAVQVYAGVGSKDFVVSAKTALFGELECLDIADAISIVLLTGELVSKTSETSEFTWKETEAIELISVGVCVCVELLPVARPTEELAA